MFHIPFVVHPSRAALFLCGAECTATLSVPIGISACFVSLLIAPWPIISFNLHNFTSIYTQYSRIMEKWEWWNSIVFLFSVKRKFLTTFKQFLRDVLWWVSQKVVSKPAGEIFFAQRFSSGCQLLSGVFMSGTSIYDYDVVVIHMPFRLLRINFMVKPLI